MVAASKNAQTTTPISNKTNPSAQGDRDLMNARYGNYITKPLKNANNYHYQLVGAV